MTIPTDYLSLQTAIAERRERVGDAAFEAQIPTFVGLAEARLNRNAKVRAAETDSVIVATPGSRLIDLPAGFVEPIALWITTGGARRDLLQAYAAGSVSLSETSAEPTSWAINGAAVEFDCPADAAHTFLLRYRSKIFALAADADTNWLLTNNPDVYLFAGLVEAADFEGDDNAAVKYEVRLLKALAEVVTIENRGKTLARMRVDPALGGGGDGFNITTG